MFFCPPTAKKLDSLLLVAHLIIKRGREVTLSKELCELHHHLRIQKLCEKLSTLILLQKSCLLLGGLQSQEKQFT